MPTGITSSLAFRNSAHDGGRIAWLDAGPQAASFDAFDGPRPPSGGDPSASVKLFTMRLSKPCGLAADGNLALASTDAPMVLANGSPTWARFYNGAGEWAFDCDASVNGGTGQVQVPAVPIYAGGRARLASAVLGQP